MQNRSNNLCIACHQQDRYVDGKGIVSPYCSKKCRDSWTISTTSTRGSNQYTGSTNGSNSHSNLCAQCHTNVRWIDSAGNQTPFCSRACKAAAASAGTPTTMSYGSNTQPSMNFSSPPTHQGHNQGNLCTQCGTDPRWISPAGIQSPFCSIACRNAAATQPPTPTISTGLGGGGGGGWGTSGSGAGGGGGNSNLCVQCGTNARWVDGSGTQSPFCSKGCKAAAGAQSPTSTPAWCRACGLKPCYVDTNGAASLYCSKTCSKSYQTNPGPGNFGNQGAGQASSGNGLQRSNTRSNSTGNVGDGFQGSNTWNSGTNNSTGTGGPMCAECHAYPVFVTPQGRPSKYCSRTCREDARSHQVPTTPTTPTTPTSGRQTGPMCLTCHAYPCWIDPATGRASSYCSKTCARKAAEQQICRTCGVRKAFSEDEKTSLYCSRECADAAKKTAANNDTVSSLDPLEIGLSTLQYVVLPVLKFMAPNADVYINAGIEG
ncbi:hypothetical protein BC938DRAFT_474128 [Jimgerdemannia flammicorona]|uniref:Uncharacterized protein n=1 Tax=Jimgerdemannia flammicorona TaxID=994334 RepID=A0A433Q2Q6_9FUNG|nr:hypothetical protein BC938DRAFT_474128 [Jimgerdemannia flammicorona]